MRSMGTPLEKRFTGQYAKAKQPPEIPIASVRREERVCHPLSLFLRNLSQLDRQVTPASSL